MRLPRACLFLFAAALSPSALPAATHASAHHLATTTVTTHHADANVRHLIFPHHLYPALDLPAQPLQSSINPPSSIHGFSLASFAVHSVLGFFAHPAR